MFCFAVSNKTLSQYIHQVYLGPAQAIPAPWASSIFSPPVYFDDIIFVNLFSQPFCKINILFAYLFLVYVRSTPAPFYFKMTFFLGRYEFYRS